MLDRTEDLGRGLSPAAERDQVVVELLNPDADPIHAGVLHRAQLVEIEQLRDALEGHFEAGRYRTEDPAHAAEQPLVLVGQIEIGRPSAEIDRRELGVAEMSPIELALHFQIPDVAV